MKKKFILLLCLILACVGLAGCSSEQSNVSPQDAIKKVYGNSEFRISFNANGLDAPLDDITYSAYKIPALPTPERIGYIFAGWYLDAEYTIPYTDGILYLYMTDVTLYAKWEKESFVQNGIYDVEYSATILEDTIKKGELTDRYGGYKDFTESLIENEICLEKTDGSLLLKLQYDTERTLPMTSNLQVYSVKISSKNGSDVYIDKRIDSYADPIKTVFINLGNFNLENTLYLDVQTSNWEEENLNDLERQKTTTKYTVAFDFTRIIGFSKPYADPDVPLEEGYYLAKSYYKSITGEESMSASFNPVYSYIYSDGKNYTLIKQNIPYGGLASLNASTLTETAKNYYARLMSLIPTMLYYEIASPPQGKEEVKSDWYPSEYGALYYGDYAVEYHADTGKFYNIFNLGNSVKKSFVVMSAVTGFMEVASGMSYINQILTIDYEHIVKLASVDYEPLSGDAYQYQTKMQYYPGDENDLKQKGLNYEIMMENGLSTDMVNFFFSTQNLDLPTSSRRQYSSRITVTPTVGTNAKTVADSRYVMANFDVNAQVFGYDVLSNEELFADVMTVQKMGSTGLRRNIRIATGKSCKVGETIRLAEVYAEKCNLDTDFSQVSYKAYAMNVGKINYGEEIDLKNSAFTFERDIAVVFETDNGSGKNHTVVELATYEEPTVEIQNLEEFPYEPNATYVVGEEISYPYLTYSWMGRRDVMIDDYYYSGSGTGEIKRGVSPVKAAVFKIEGDNYDLSETPNYQANKFTIPFEEFAIVYELTNKYGELYHYFIPFSSKWQTEYRIENGKGEVCFKNTLKYDKNTGERLAISHSFDTEILSADTVKEQFERIYRFVIGDSVVNIPLVSYDIYSNIEQQNYPIDNANLIWDKIKDREYAVIRLNYANGEEGVEVSATFVFGVTFNGSSSPYSLTFSDYFVGQEYTFGIPKLYSSAGALVKEGTAKLDASGKYGSLKKDGSQYRLSFNESGQYTLYHSFSLGNITLSFDQELDVWSDTTDVTITYVTDAEHPFDDGTLERTVTYSLAEDIYTIKKNAFSSSVAASDVLYGWTATIGGYASSAYRSGEALTDFIGDFNAKHVTLYAFWDPGLTLTVNAGEGTVYTQTYYLNSRGYYDIELELFSVNAPKGYEFVGWSGKVFGDRIYNKPYCFIYTVDWSDSEYGEITAVFKKLYTVKFYVDPTYSNAFFRNEIVLDGEKIKDVSTKQNISCKVDGYRFAGWYVQGDETQTVIDLATFVITGDVTLVAKFVPTEESVL